MTHAFGTYFVKSDTIAIYIHADITLTSIVTQERLCPRKKIGGTEV